MSEAVDGAAVRRDWDRACARAETALRAARDSAAKTWLAQWLTTEIDQLATLRALVDGKRRLPGSTASGLLHDVPPDLREPAFAEAMSAVSEVDRLYESGLDASGWDWSRGYPPGWPSSLKDRVRSYLPVHKA